jgi:hypothetical protein
LTSIGASTPRSSPSGAACRSSSSTGVTGGPASSSRTRSSSTSRFSTTASAATRRLACLPRSYPDRVRDSAQHRDRRVKSSLATPRNSGHLRASIEVRAVHRAQLRPSVCAPERLAAEPREIQLRDPGAADLRLPPCPARDHPRHDRRFHEVTGGRVSDRSSDGRSGGTRTPGPAAPDQRQRGTLGSRRAHEPVDLPSANEHRMLTSSVARGIVMGAPVDQSATMHSPSCIDPSCPRAPALWRFSCASRSTLEARSPTSWSRTMRGAFG